MEKKNKCLVIIIIILSVILCALVTYTVVNRNNRIKSKNEYTIKYYDGGIPGNNYLIVIDKDISIKVTKTAGCSTVECSEESNTPESETYKVKFSSDIKKLIKEEYIPKLFGLKTEIEFKNYGNNIDGDVLNLINAILLNDESMLTNNCIYDQLKDPSALTENEKKEIISFIDTFDDRKIVSYEEFKLVGKHLYMIDGLTDFKGDNSFKFIVWKENGVWKEYYIQPTGELSDDYIVNEKANELDSLCK